ncbi:hypothetical protein WANG_1124 [Lactobacillus kefiranofaciens subsp. kefiranofaciens]|nr:hypothetical protein WANG_1124 [Lactobacillus kefiranofaciens subsp. kefiranofaciens]
MALSMVADCLRDFGGRFDLSSILGSTNWFPFISDNNE